MSDKPVNDIRDMVKSMSSLPEGSGESEYNFRIYVNPVVQIRDMLDGMIGEGGSGLIADGSVTTDKLADGAVTQDKLSDDISLGGAGTYFGNCVSTADAAVKVVTVEDQNFSLTTGTRVRVQFVNGNTNNGVQNQISLNVNDTGNHAVLYRGNTPGSSAATPFYFAGNTKIIFTYNEYGFWEAEEASNNYFVKCVTAANDGTKILSPYDGMVIVDGTSVTVEFEHGNTANSLYLSVNSLSLPIFYDDDYTSSVNKFTWDDYAIITFVFKQGVWHTTSIGPVMGQSGGGSQTTWYGTCSTAVATGTKVVACSGFELKDGAIILVKFSAANSSPSPQLNVNSTGAKYIWGYGGYKTFWDANVLLTFVYANDYWHLISNIPSNYFSASSSQASYKDKVVNVPPYAIIAEGTIISVKFNYANTYTTDSVRLSIGTLDTANICVNGSVTSSTNQLLWDAKDVLTFVRRQNVWHLIAKYSAPAS